MKKNKKVYVLLRKTIIDCAGYDTMDDSRSGVVCIMNSRERIEAFAKGVMTGLSLGTNKRTFRTETIKNTETIRNCEFAYAQNEETYPKIKFVCISDVIL
jgi:hypothetical protein